jgi:hypothetical protein
MGPLQPIMFTMRQEIETNARRISAINQQLELEIMERSRIQAEIMKVNRFLEEKILIIME